MRKSTFTLVAIVGVALLFKFSGTSFSEVLSTTNFKPIIQEASDSTKGVLSNILGDVKDTVVKEHIFNTAKEKITVKLLDTKNKSLNSILTNSKWKTDNNSNTTKMVDSKDAPVIEVSLFKSKDKDKTINKYIYAGKENPSKNDIPSLTKEEEENDKNASFFKYTNSSKDPSDASCYYFITPDNSEESVLIKINNTDDKREFVQTYADNIVENMNIKAEQTSFPEKNKEDTTFKTTNPNE